MTFFTNPYLLYTNHYRPNLISYDLVHFKRIEELLKINFQNFQFQFKIVPVSTYIFINRIKGTVSRKIKTSMSVIRTLAVSHICLSCMIVLSSILSNLSDLSVPSVFNVYLPCLSATYLVSLLVYLCSLSV